MPSSDGALSDPEGGIFMHDDYTWIENLVPDLLETVRQRFKVLQQISLMAPVGRRTIAERLGISERSIRTETEFLKTIGLIDINRFGMVLTDKGEQTLNGLAPIVSKLFNASQTEIELAKKLGIDRTIIVQGNSDLQSHILHVVGEELSKALDLLLPLGKSTITVLGGKTMAEVSTSLSPNLSHHRSLMFVPGRGALGESMEIQSNTVCQMMAQSSHGKYRALYLPENVSPEVLRSLIQDPSIREVLDYISNSDAVIHGIGSADTMAQRRDLDLNVRSKLRQADAVVECFGYFFNREGKVIYKIPRIGLQLEDLFKMPHVFAIATGQKKATAIRAYMHNAPSQTWLITDEGAANSILNGK